MSSSNLTTPHWSTSSPPTRWCDMTAPQTSVEQVLALPSGAGGVAGLGETFTADPYTGTGQFRVVIPAPAGHGGLGPQLALVYSSGVGAGLCGVGWSFGI